METNCHLNMKKKYSNLTLSTLHLPFLPRREYREEKIYRLDNMHNGYFFQFNIDLSNWQCPRKVGHILFSN